MKIITIQGTVSLIRLDRGEEFIQTIQDYCSSNSIYAAYLTAIGACGALHLSWYDVHNKVYITKEIKEDLEIASLTGNISLVKGSTFCHVHGTFSNKELVPIAGHIKKMIISATCEIRLESFLGKIQRTHDVVTGLNLMK